MVGVRVNDQRTWGVGLASAHSDEQAHVPSDTA
jgi:hypothetical protein